MTQETLKNEAAEPPQENKQERQQKEKPFLQFVAFTVVFIVTLTLVLFTDQREKTSSEIGSHAIVTQNEYKQLIANGDLLLAEGNYNNAAIEYRTALELVPKDSIATLRLISASDLNCQVNSKDCQESEQLLEAYVNY